MELKRKGKKVMFMKTVLTMLFAIFVSPAMAQSTFASDNAGEGALSFPDFDYQKECEKIGQLHFNNPKPGDTTIRVNNCLDEEASSRKSAEYKWETASENARAKAMAQVDYIRRDNGFYSACRFYLYLDGSLSDFSRLEARDAANKRLHEKRPGVHY